MLFLFKKNLSWVTCGISLLIFSHSAFLSATPFSQVPKTKYGEWSLRLFPDGHKEFGPAKLWKRGEIYVLHLKGSPYERGLQHGTLLREEIRQGAIPYLAKKLDREIASSPGIPNIPGLRKILLAYADWFVFRRIYRRMPKEYLEGARGIADGSGLTEEEFRRAIAMPDAMVVLAKTLFGRYLMEAISVKTFACSSFAAFGRVTASGRLIHARNMDFPGVGFWDRFRTVLYVEPDHGLRHVAITSAGVHTAGVTSMNEAGVIYSLHQNFTSNVSPEGMPVVNIGEEIISKAKNLEEAIEIVKKSRFAGSWTFVLSHAGSPEKAIVAEISPDHLSIRKAENEVIAATNVNLTEALREKQIFFNRSVEEDNICRYRRLLDLLRQYRGKVTPQLASEMLGDRFDLLTRRVRSVGRTISSVYNTQSAVFDPQAGRFWVSNSEAPANTGDFIGFTFKEGFQEDFSLSVRDRLKGNVFRYDPRFPGVKKYIAAYKAYFDGKDEDEAYRLILQAIESDSQESAYQIVAGLLALKREDYTNAREHFLSAKKLELTKHQKRLIALFLGRSYDLLDQRETAIHSYREGLDGDDIDPKLKEALKEGLRSPFQSAQMRKIPLQLDYADTLSY